MADQQYDLVTNQPVRNAHAVQGVAGGDAHGRVRSEKQDTHHLPRKADGKVDARVESVDYDLVTGKPRAQRPARSESPRKRPEAQQSPRRRRAPEEPQVDVDVMGRPKQLSPRKRGTGRQTVDFMDHDRPAEKHDPKASSKAKRAIANRNTDPSVDPVTGRPKPQAQRRAAARESGGGRAAPFGTDGGAAGGSPTAGSRSTVHSMERESHEMHRDVNPLTGEKKKVRPSRRSSNGSYTRGTSVGDPVNPITGAAKKTAGAPGDAAGGESAPKTTGAMRRERQAQGSNVDVLGNPRHEQVKRSSSGTVSREYAGQQEHDPITGKPRGQETKRSTGGTISRERNERAANPITGK